MSKGQEVSKRDKHEQSIRILEEEQSRDTTPIDQVVELWDMYDIPYEQMDRMKGRWRDLGIDKSDKERFRDSVKKMVEAIQACHDAERQCEKAKMKYRSACVFSSLYGFYHEADDLIAEDQEGLLRDLQNKSGFWEEK